MFKNKQLMPSFPPEGKSPDGSPFEGIGTPIGKPVPSFRKKKGDTNFFPQEYMQTPL